MPNKRELKLLLNSRSWEFVYNHRRGNLGRDVATYRWRGKAVRYRPGTSDAHIIHQVLLRKRARAAYHIPIYIKPRGILDIGAHIGCAALYFASQYPNTAIYSFEPVPENFKLLQQNVGEQPNIRAFNVALGDKDSLRNIRAANPHNLASFSFYQAEDNNDRNSKCKREKRRAI